MTIAYNSAYIQTETLNFTFAQQAVIVYFDVKCWLLMYIMIMASSAAWHVHHAVIHSVVWDEWPFCVY